MNITCDAMGNPPPTYQWFRNGKPLEGATQPTLELTHVTIDDRGIYNCEVYNSVPPEIYNRTCVDGMIVTETQPR